jgi:phosphoribosyl 1,2-cyclic phosphate phosphodiesterase
METTLTILGCGGSAGVPAIGNWWGKCDPHNSKNRRMRPSIAVQTKESCLIVDTGPDFKEQMNMFSLPCPHAIIYTHEHSDHVNGIDELRTLERLNKCKFDIYGEERTLQRIERRFDYMFHVSEDGFYSAVCIPNVVSMYTRNTVMGIDFIPFLQRHGSIDSLGLRFGSVGYSTDVKSLDDHAYAVLKGIETWIVDAAGHHHRANPVHACIDEVIEMNEKIGAKQVFLTHMPPSMDYEAMCAELPTGYAPAYDGQVIPIQI